MPDVQRVDACLSLGQRCARGQPCNLLVVLAVPPLLGPLLVGERQRDPNLHVRVEEGERRGQHADHPVERVVQPQVTPDHPLDAAGLTLGKRVAENGNAVVSGDAILLPEQPAACCAGAQHAEEGGRHVHRRDAFRIRAPSHAKPAELIERP